MCSINPIKRSLSVYEFSFDATNGHGALMAFDYAARDRLQDLIVSYVGSHQGATGEVISNIFCREGSSSGFVRLMKDLRTKERLFGIKIGKNIFYFTNAKLRDSYALKHDLNKDKKSQSDMQKAPKNTLDNLLNELRKTSDIGGYWAAYLGVANEAKAQ
jgi:hypothetical protein